MYIPRVPFLHLSHLYWETIKAYLMMGEACHSGHAVLADPGGWAALALNLSRFALL